MLCNYPPEGQDHAHVSCVCNVVISGTQMVVSVTYIVRSARLFSNSCHDKQLFCFLSGFVVNLSTTEHFTWRRVSLSFHNRCLPLLHTYIEADTIFLLIDIAYFLLDVTEDAFVF